MPPVAVAGVIAGAATIGGAIISSKSQSKSADKAAQISADNTRANNKLARETYAKNEQHLGYFENLAKPASSILAGLLYGEPMAAPSGVQTNQVIGTPTPNTPAAPVDSALGGYVGPGAGTASTGGLPGSQYFLDQNDGSVLGGIRSLTGALIAAKIKAKQNRNDIAGVPSPTAVAPVTTGAPTSALSAWDTFRNSTNYQFRLNQGLEALNQGWAAKGALNSGAAARSINDYAQNFAANELGSYMDRLAAQQGLGFSAASALAGVGQNYVGTVTANNNMGASNAANAALMQGQANANMWGGIASGVGTIAGALGSSYKKVA